MPPHPRGVFLFRETAIAAHNIMNKGTWSRDTELYFFENKNDIPTTFFN